MLGVSDADIESQLDFVKSCYTPAMQELLSTKDIPALASERNGEKDLARSKPISSTAFVATTSVIFAIVTKVLNGRE